MSGVVWAPLRQELDRWAEAGRTAPFWLRDDDAVRPTPALAQLLQVTGRCAVPLTLAVIPEGAGAALAETLADKQLVEVAVHGWSHRNHAPEGAKKQELGPHRPMAEVLGELARGLCTLDRLFGRARVPILVPPWNRIDPAVLTNLPGLGFRALSVFGPEEPSALPCLNAHVDLIDWHGSRGGRDPEVLVNEIVGRMQQAYGSGGATGLLTHHLVHDAAAWRFLEQVLAVTNAHPACRWYRAQDLLWPN